MRLYNHLRVYDQLYAFQYFNHRAVQCSIKQQRRTDCTVLWQNGSQSPENHVVRFSSLYCKKFHHPPHLLYEGIFFFFFAVWLLIIDWCNGFSPLYCVFRILTLFSLPEQRGAGAIDVISFLEARGEDPLAIQCLSLQCWRGKECRVYTSMSWITVRATACWRRCTSHGMN